MRASWALLLLLHTALHGLPYAAKGRNRAETLFWAAVAAVTTVWGVYNCAAAFTAPATLYAAAYTANPSDSGGGTEATGGSYARVSTAAGDWNTATNADPSVVDNANAITFTTATADWVSGADLTYAVFYDAATAGNFLGSAALTTAKPVLNGDTGFAVVRAAAKPVLNGDTAEFAAGDISWSLD